MSEESRPMTPTEEEAELARVIAKVETADWALGTSAFRKARQEYRRRLAKRILSAGWRKREHGEIVKWPTDASIRNDALEEAAKVADGVQGEFKAEHDRHGWIANKLCAQAAHVVAARIRALKAKT